MSASRRAGTRPEGPPSEILFPMARGIAARRETGALASARQTPEDRRGALLASRKVQKRMRPPYWPPGVDSELEMALYTRLEQHGLPLGEGQVRIVEGRQFAWDRAWRSEKVAVEVQGGLHINGAHSRGAGVERDCLKQSLAAALGWRCLPISKAMIESGEAIRLIRQALAHREDTP